MSDTTQSAYDAACRAAWEIRESCMDSLRSQIDADELRSEDDLHDAIHTTVDDALIYTADQYACVWGLTDGDDAIEDLGGAPGNFHDALAMQAYQNLMAAIDFGELIKRIESRQGGDL